jgi:hypothetical protein
VSISWSLHTVTALRWSCKFVRTLAITVATTYSLRFGKKVVLNKVLVKHLKYKWWITFKLLSFEMWKSYQ